MILFTISDLKKLIRHDQMKSKENTTPTAPMSPCKRKSCQQPSLADHNKQTTNKSKFHTESSGKNKPLMLKHINLMTSY